MKRTPCRSLATLIFALVILLAQAAALKAQSRPRRVKAEPAPVPVETRPRRVHQPVSVKLPTEADAARFFDRINKLINDYLQPLQPLSTKHKQ